ncbi:MAG: hypothetical protein ACLUT1_03825 [Ruminococcus sp.]|nr:hypothetical protein [Ruminococcus sp.]DAP07568.1 MAG TPA: hypothetical protein [Caudoviricetes sp.]
MEEKKKHIEIRIQMDENERITPSSKMSNVSGDNVIDCYLTGAVYVANIVAGSSNGVCNVNDVLGEMLRKLKLLLAIQP